MKYIGKWTGRVDTSFFKGSAVVDIFDNGGEYGFKVTGLALDKIPEFEVTDIVEGENSLSGKAIIKVFGGIKADVNVTFDGDTFKGDIKIPVFGSVPILDGRRIG